MSESLLGVIVGGIIASIGTMATTWLQYKKWKSENKVRILERDIESLKKEAKGIILEFNNLIMNGACYPNKITEAKINFPESVTAILTKKYIISNMTREDKEIIINCLASEINKYIKAKEKEMDKLLK